MILARWPEWKVWHFIWLEQRLKSILRHKPTTFRLKQHSGKIHRNSQVRNTSAVVLYITRNCAHMKTPGTNIIISFSNRDSDGGRWICGNIENTREQITAVATFKYPLVGSIYFLQEANNPWSETRLVTSLSEFSCHLSLAISFISFSGPTFFVWSQNV